MHSSLCVCVFFFITRGDKRRRWLNKRRESEAQKEIRFRPNQTTKPNERSTHTQTHRIDRL